MASLKDQVLKRSDHPLLVIRHHAVLGEAVLAGAQGLAVPKNNPKRNRGRGGGMPFTRRDSPLGGEDEAHEPNTTRVTRSQSSYRAAPSLPGAVGASRSSVLTN